MLNGDLKKRAIQRFEEAKEIYESLAEKVGMGSEKLMILRKDDANEMILRAEALFSQIANKPKTFDKAFAEYRAEFRVFNAILEDIQDRARSVDRKAGSAAGAGVAAGVGVAAFAPTAAMAIATTFGTASTGTAISALSGAAATKAALAWLGGGALTAGGAGMAGGKALLALAGPLGWAIGGTALVGSGLFARRKNAKIAEEANEKRYEIETLNSQFRAAITEINRLIEETQSHVHGMSEMMTLLDNTLTSFDFDDFSQTQKNLMITIKNHVESLSMLIKTKVDL